MIYLILLIALLGFDRQPLTIEATAHSISQSDSRIGKEEQEILNLINQQRSKYGLDDLEWDAKLAELAADYSEKMARERFFSHYDKNGESVADRAAKAKITRWSKIGENLFTCQGYAKFTKLAVKSWLESSEHRRNMLDEDYTQTGIGIAKAKSGKIYITQVFIQR
jgi:uncharacterized protein YkwD